ncbi:MAG: type II toxin-antitoxin system HicA family toxin [Methylovulum sp.]|uniref:type II toxin-antitoxin system HicA family toxin n=1 Tax=Methylovulum sp. TaxID=1916980 RepID=UPI002634D4A8|nr:type II toxin-antitoxin system HicA family toxin [Methylovulum sp.]MDD2723712.1 type II toxin-antitoxin system HicA family toxin [Methylovulum sp.]MDD5123314.1 type II toxin-antitoxin system HicA family toxin [Methylovulum sp.]
MPKLKRLTAKQVLAILSGFGFIVVSQRGSHIKMMRMVLGQKQILTVPNHDELDTGTCKAIMRQASRYISAEQLYPYFYSE